MESEPEEAGLSHTGPLSRGIFSSRKSIGRCLTLRPQRVPVSSICDDNQSEDESGQLDTDTPSHGSATIGTVSAILKANRRSERNPSGDQPAANSCPDKENTAGRRLAHPYDLLTPLPRRAGLQSAGRTPRQPLGSIDTPYKEPAAPQPTAASAVKRPFLFGEPAAEKRHPPLQHASRSHSSLSAAVAERPAAGLSRGLSEGRLPGTGELRHSLPVVTEGSSEGTPPEQRAVPLNQSGSAPAAGPTSRVSPATAAAAGTPRPPNSTPAPSQPQDARSEYLTPYRRAPGQEPVGRQAVQLAAAGTSWPPKSAPAPGQLQDARNGYVTPYRRAPGQDAGGRQPTQQEAHGGASGASRTVFSAAAQDCRATYPTPYGPAAATQGSGEQYAARSAADTRIGAPQVKPVSRWDGVDGQWPSRAATRQVVPGSLPQQPATRPGASGTGSTPHRPATMSGQEASHQLPSSVRVAATSSSRGDVGPRPASLHTSATFSAGQSRLGLSTPSPVAATAATVVSAFSVFQSSSVASVSSSGPSVMNSGPSVLSSGPSVLSSGLSVMSSGLSVLSGGAPPRVPGGTTVTPAGQSGVPRPPQADCGTQTEGLASAAMPPPPTEMFFGKRQLHTLTVNQRDYIVMKQIGRGGSSKVYQVFDAEMHSRAIKQVFLENTDDVTASGYKNEIKLLGNLQHSDRVVRLIDWEHRVDRQMLYIVMEKGDTDLTALLRSYTRLNEVDANMCKFFWGEMLRCVDVIHKEGIIHSDLKPSNFLMVAGRLKLIDFGIASQIQSDCTSIIKDAQVGTFNYMSPEAIEAQQVTRNGASQTAIKISRRSDVWSLGCILFNFVYGITPFGHIKQVMGKLMAIVNPKHEIEFPPVSDCHLLAVLRSCLRRDPYERPSIEQLLTDPYLTGCRCQCQR